MRHCRFVSSAWLCVCLDSVEVCLEGVLEQVGHVYLAQPPLYRIDAAKETHWALDDGERDRVLGSLPKNVSPRVSRFKGLGEMPAEDLKATTLDPKNRRALRVMVDEDTAETMQTLMGKDPAPRFRFIMDRATGADAEALDV